jgi:hypothetical protein
MVYRHLRSRKDLVRLSAWVPTPEDLKTAIAGCGALKQKESGRIEITVGEAIRTQIANLRRFATAAIRREGKDPSRYEAIIEENEFADRALCAALILKNLDSVERSLVPIEEWGNPQEALDALFLALECAYYWRLLTITDHEQEIVIGARTARNMRESSSKANAARHKRHNRKWVEWNAEAARIWERKPDLSRQAVAHLVKSKLNLSEREGTIAKRLTKPRMAG